MTPAGRVRRFAAALAAAGLLAGCATTNVNSFVARGVDFSQFKTYAWAPESDLATGDPRLDNNPFFMERVRASAERELAARGFGKVTSGMPDLVLHYHASVRQQLDLSTVDQKYGDCDTCGASVFDQGTLTLDLVDARTNKLIWRGWSERSLDGVVDNQDIFEKQIDQAVVRIVQTVPRAL
jgi:hypothetical protein